MTRKGQWKPGQSGNPAGRKANPLAERFRKAVEPKLPAIITAMIDAAANGDVQAAKLLLDRAIPTLKPVPRAEPFPISGQSLTDRAESILNAVASGMLTPMEGKGLIDSLIGISKLIEADELERRIAALEARNDAPA